MLLSYQLDFIKTALACNALKFGQFTLKSGRISPYFFDAGCFQTGAHLASLGKAYAATIVSAQVDFNLLFGPAYKGIPLAAVTAVALNEIHAKDVAYCYNRKEVKDHGEGGGLVGAPLQGKVAIVDDVITAGTAIREVLSIIESCDAQPAAIIIGLDRQERGQNNHLSAIQELEQATGVPVKSIITLDNILTYLESQGDLSLLKTTNQYRKTYGV